MPQLSRNIPSMVFYVSISPELFRIPRCTLRINDFIPRASDLFPKMMAQIGNRSTVPKQLKNVFHRYLTVLKKIGNTDKEMNIRIMKST